MNPSTSAEALGSMIRRRIEHTTNLRPHLGVKVHRDVRHPIGNLRNRVLVVGEDIAKGLQRLRFEISQCGLAHGVRD